MDSTAVGITLGSGAVIAAIMQFLKVWLERVLPPEDPRHDPTIQLLAAIVGMVGFVAHAASLGPLTGPSVWDAAGQGFLAGLAAIVQYHVLSSPLAGIGKNVLVQGMAAPPPVAVTTLPPTEPPPVPPGSTVA